MIFRKLRDRLATMWEGYAWLWRATQAHARTPITGVLRFIACAIEDVLLLGAWSASTPLRQPVQRHRVVVPALAFTCVMMLTLDSADGPESAPFGDAPVAREVGAACGGGVTFGAIASPGDELVAFEACANAYVTLEADCEECWIRPPAPGRLLPELRLADFTI